MKKIMSYLMLSCRRATALIEKKLLVGLTRKEKMQLWMHTSMCDACTAYQKQSKWLDKILQKYFFGLESNGTEENKNLKTRILSKL